MERSLLLQNLLKLVKNRKSIVSIQKAYAVHHNVKNHMSDVPVLVTSVLREEIVHHSALVVYELFDIRDGVSIKCLCRTDNLIINILIKS